MFDQNKSLFASKTIWGALLAIAAPVVGMAGYTMTAADQAEIVTLVTSAMSLVGGAVALWGRITATKRIG